MDFSEKKFRSNITQILFQSEYVFRNMNRYSFQINLKFCTDLDFLYNFCNHFGRIFKNIAEDKI